MEQPFSIAPLASASCVLCELRMMEVMSSGTSSAGETEEHNVENRSLDVVWQDRSGMLIDVFLEDWEPARAAVSCRLALEEVQDAW